MSPINLLIETPLSQKMTPIGDPGAAMPEKLMQEDVISRNPKCADPLARVGINN